MNKKSGKCSVKGSKACQIKLLNVSAKVVRKSVSNNNEAGEKGHH